jgi:hypothetical protein
MSVARSLWKNQALMSSGNAWPPLAGCLLQVALRATGTHCAAVKDGDYAPTVSRTVVTPLALRLATPARLEGRPRALLHPKRLSARTKQYGPDFALFGVRRLHLSLRLPSSSANGRPGMAATCTSVRTMISPSPMGVHPKRRKNKGAFGISMALWCSGRCRPKTR